MLNIKNSTILLTIFLIVHLSYLLAQENVVIDGRLDDWRQKPLNYDKANKLWYEFRNDSAYLYLAIYKDENAAKAVSLGGIRVFLDTKPVDAASLCLLYGNAGMDVKGQKVSYNPEQLIISNFQGRKVDTLSIYNEFGIQASSELHIDEHSWALRDYSTDPQPDKSSYNLEMAIPLVYLKTGSAGVKKVYFSINLRGTDLEESGQNYQRMAQLQRGQLTTLQGVWPEMLDTQLSTKNSGQYELK